MKNRHFFLAVGAVVAIIIGSLPHQFFWWFSTHLKTYPGDIWYVFDHYVGKGFPFPVEYPSLMRVFVQLVNTVTTKNYTIYLWTTIYFLLPFAIGTTLIMAAEAENLGRPWKNLWIYWVLAPSFIVCATTNYDLAPLFTLVLGLYLAKRGSRPLGGALLGVGTAFKVFPAFFLPLILLMKKDLKEQLKVIAAFFGTWLAINVPYVIGDPQGFKGWFSPYLWQSSCNYSKGPGDGSLWWHLYVHTGKFSGTISLFLILSAIVFIAWKAFSRRDFTQNVWDWAAGVAMIFLLFDKVYSPQYHLYLLPFIALSRSRISLLAFYLFELPNVAQLIFLFSVREPPYMLQWLITIKYGALIYLVWQFFRDIGKSPADSETEAVSCQEDREGKSLLAEGTESSREDPGAVIQCDSDAQVQEGKETEGKEDRQ